MAESGIPYTLVAPGGTLKFNDLTADATYLLTQVNDLETATIRTSQHSKPGLPGVILGNQQKGALTPSLEGVLAFRTLQQRRDLQKNLLIALNSMIGADAQLKWRPSAAEDERALTVRIVAKPDITGGVIKTFLIPMIADDPTISSTTLTTVNTSTVTAGVGGGLMMPFTFPIQFDFDSSAGTASISYTGDLESYPVIDIWGAISTPEIRNLTTGKIVRLTSSVGASDFVRIDMGNQTVTLNGVTNLLGALDVLTSDWWSLVPGTNQIQLAGVSPVNAFAAIKYRNAWAF